ncbi:receptor-type tyrosine-protein phosphatase H-like [Salarias fasciatus]|uniref:receptor-type tyrosine-protein phosphatase H-like n=1 Tax=Salarias fasciatus TaxID=181472 RepID=UPI001176BCED|nr:receptor-type tyrosine-protein phosphatase H-like [Salarias fasciatus]
MAVLIFIILVCVALFIFIKRPDIIRSVLLQAIPASKFQNHFSQFSSDNNKGFRQEYDHFSLVSADQPQKVATQPENKVKNRFSDVLPYDSNRVKLTTSGSAESSDYINASYMPGYRNNREYIATQGPLPATVDDFWRMIWEQQVKGIVMVTNCTELGQTKCEQYWPSGRQSRLFGVLSVTTISERQEPNWTLRTFSVKHRNTSEERTVKHFHFTAWPNRGVPQSTDVLIQFRGLVRQHIEREGGRAPTVVHCSAGVGRTGTIIALDVLLQQLENEQAVDINAFVHRMRLNRPYMVQTESQYVFLHQCIADSQKRAEEHIYENPDMIYVNAAELQDLR